MLWLIWEMWIVLALFFAGGVITGWVLRGRSDASQAPEAAQLGFATRMEAQRPAEPAPAYKPEPMPFPEPSTETDAQADPGLDVAREAGPGGEDLTAIRGLGPKAAEKLQALGVTRYAQIAAWDEADVARLDEALAARGRIVRDDWVGQARRLAS